MLKCWKAKYKIIYISLPHTLHKKWINELNIKAQTIKLFEENIRLNLHDLEFGDGFLEITPKA